jgi:hypothetical protein
MLSEHDLAGLTNRLQVPLIVQDILNDQGALTDDVHYGLHEVLSNYEPDSALLCIALSARKIASRFQHRIANLAVLKMECDRIIADYAELWLSNAQRRPIDDNVVFDTLMNIPEDLECLAELLEINQTFLTKLSQDAADLCEILIIQANAQVIVAETFVEIMDKEEADIMANDNGLAEMPAKVASISGSNIIQFPRRAG